MPRRIATGRALIIVFVFWLLGAHPAVAIVTKLGLATEPGFAPVPVFVPISDPAETVEDDACSLACRRLGNLPIGSDFGSNFLTVHDFRKRFHYRPQNVDCELRSRKNFSPDLNVFRDGFSDIEGENRGSNPDIIFSEFPTGDLNGVDLNFRTVGGSEFLPRTFDTLTSKSCLFVRRNPKSESETGDRNGGEISEKSVVLVDQSQRARSLHSDVSDEVALVIGIFGGILGALFTYARLERVCELVFGPDKYA